MKPKYEWLKVRNVFTDECIYDDNGEYISWEESIPKGWNKAFGEAMINELNDILVKYDFVNHYRIYQIKEKYGMLCWYPGGVPEAMYDDYDYNAWKIKYENLSLETCIECGEKATHMTTGWIMPLCDECDKNINK